MATVTTHERRAPGRPREFDLDEALDRALLVFRERGYHAASLIELGTTMQLTPGSIYKAFRDKRAIFLAAFDRYTELRHAALQERVAGARDGRAKLRATLLFYAEAAHGAEGRRGCLVVAAAAEMATFDAEMAERVTMALRRVEVLLRDLVFLGQADASVPSKLDAEACAYALLCLVQGLRVVGKTGRTHDATIAAVDQALRLVA